MINEVVRADGVTDGPLPPSPSFSHPPHNLTVGEGDEATLLCGVAALHGHKVAWVHEDSQSILTVGSLVYTQSPRLSLVTDHERSALTLDPVMAGDRGWYMCQVNTDPMISARAFLQVFVQPTIIKWSGPVLEAREGTSVTLDCEVRSHPPALVTWTRSDLQPILPASRGGPDAPMLWLEREMVGGHLGEDATLECTADAHPLPTVTWTSGNRSLHHDGIKYSTSIDSMNGDAPRQSSRQRLTLSVLEVAHADFGLYGCIVENRLGRAEATIDLYEIREQVIRGPPVHHEHDRKCKHRVRTTPAFAVSRGPVQTDSPKSEDSWFGPADHVFTQSKGIRDEGSVDSATSLFDVWLEYERSGAKEVERWRILTLIIIVILSI
ncbi:Immunoglobulin I-set [Trinorchestia longiramus]|nr:Immunoglobulin I-set [Trinorchestia longiramus]